MSVKIFQIGFNKCGTSTLARFFKRNGLPIVHWARGDLARRIERAREAGEDPLGFFRDVAFFCDMIALDEDRVYEGYKHFDYLHQHYPDALFILNTRERESWIASRHRHGNFTERFRKVLGVRTVAEVEDYWRRDWAEQHERVKAFFADKPGQLLVFDLGTDGPEKLIAFAGAHYTLDAKHWEARNVTAMRPDKRAGKTAKFLEDQGRDAADRITAEDLRRMAEMKGERRRKRAEENATQGRWVVRRGMLWKLRLTSAVSAVRRLFGRAPR